MKTVSEASQRGDFAALGVEFDLWYGESDVADHLNDLVAKLEETGVAEISDGALVVRVEEPGDNREWPPLILRTSAGGFLYSTTDLATVAMRVSPRGRSHALRGRPSSRRTISPRCSGSPAKQGSPARRSPSSTSGSGR